MLIGYLVHSEMFHSFNKTLHYLVRGLAIPTYFFWLRNESFSSLAAISMLST